MEALPRCSRRSGVCWKARVSARLGALLINPVNASSSGKCECLSCSVMSKSASCPIIEVGAAHDRTVRTSLANRLKDTNRVEIGTRVAFAARPDVKASVPSEEEQVSRRLSELPAADRDRPQFWLNHAVQGDDAAPSRARTPGSFSSP